VTDARDPDAPQREPTWAERVRAAQAELSTHDTAAPSGESEALHDLPFEIAPLDRETVYEPDDVVLDLTDGHDPRPEAVPETSLHPVPRTVPVPAFVPDPRIADAERAALAAAPVEVTEPPPRGGRHVKRDRVTRIVVEWAAVVLGALVVALLIKTFLLQAFSIPSESMEPTLEVGDRVLVNKLSYRLHEINRGDLVVFERPPNQPESGINDLIKRVVGLEGDTVESRDGVVYINGKKLEEPYLVDGTQTNDITMIEGCDPPSEGLAGCRVPEDHIFVMGDNRTNSFDSRRFGPVDDDLVVGRAFVRVWPLGDVKSL
jgi:signal peptidase I